MIDCILGRRQELLIIHRRMLRNDNILDDECRLNVSQIAQRDTDCMRYGNERPMSQSVSSGIRGVRDVLIDLFAPVVRTFLGRNMFQRRVVLVPKEEVNFGRKTASSECSIDIGHVPKTWFLRFLRVRAYIDKVLQTSSWQRVVIERITISVQANFYKYPSRTTNLNNYLTQTLRKTTPQAVPHSRSRVARRATYLAMSSSSSSSIRAVVRDYAMLEKRAHYL